MDKKYLGKMIAYVMVLLPVMKMVKDLNLVFDVEAILGTILFSVGLLYFLFEGE